MENSSTGIRDTETDEPLDWGEIFFILHKHCNLDKWQIWDYTLPQVSELMKRANRYIEFEVSMKSSPLGMFGGVPAPEGYVKIDAVTEDGYQIATEDDIMSLAQVLGSV